MLDLLIIYFKVKIFVKIKWTLHSQMQTVCYLKNVKNR